MRDFILPSDDHPILRQTVKQFLNDKLATPPNLLFAYTAQDLLVSRSFLAYVLKGISEDGIIGTAV
jgi:hypothetical protein